MGTKRTIEIASKIALHENEWMKGKMLSWLRQADDWALIMELTDLATDHPAKMTRDGRKLLFLMNRICPSLHHFCKMPDPRLASGDRVAYNKAVEAHTLENTQAEFQRKDGSILQEGVEKDDENYQAFIDAVAPIMGYATGAEMLEAANASYDINCLWHVAAMENAKAIAREGLVPKIGDSSDTCGEKTPAVYLFNGFESLTTALSGWLGEELNERYGEDAEMVLIHLHMLPAQEFQPSLVFNPNLGYEVACTKAIQPKYLRFYDEEYNPVGIC